MDDSKIRVDFADTGSEDRTVVVRLAHTLNVDESALAKELAKFVESVKLPTKSEKFPIALNRAERRKLKKNKKNA
jgi:hypothetical protein